jgi:integrase
MEHRSAQGQERLVARQLWQEGDWLFTTETGAPINPRTDWDEWKRLLKVAGIRDGRLHDARHTAATVLLLLGVSERTIMGIMGWSNPAMTRRYAHMIDPIRHETASRIDGLLWASDSRFRAGDRGDAESARGSNETETETREQDAGPS